jgi:predicted Zn-dependent protease
MVRGVQSVVAAGVLGGMLGGMLGGCSTNPTTGRNQLNLLSTQQEIAMGDQAKGELTSEYGGVVPDKTATDYVRQVGMSMVPYTEAKNPELPWEFTFLDSEVVNAFALPGGKVFMSRGLAEKLENEAELAAVLGHEIGHVTARHVNDRLSRQMGIAVGAAAVGIIVGESSDSLTKAGAAALVTGAGLYSLSFDRNQESESDSLGIRYMTRAGYNPIGMLGTMEVLASLAGEGGRQPEILATHPHPETRLKRVREQLEQEHPLALANPTTDVYAERYEQMLLSRLRALPAGRPSTAEADRVIRETLGDARTWCGVCAAEAE